MLSRKVTLIVLLLFFLAAGSQTKPGNPKQSTAETQGKHEPVESHSLVDQLLHDTCLGKKFSVVFYVVQDSINSLPSAVSMATYPFIQIINILNSTFSCICVSFENCKTVVIPNYSYNDWDPGGNGASIVKNWYTENVINIYIPERIIQSSVDPPTLSYTFPLPPVPQGTFVPTNAIVLAKGAFAVANTAGFIGSDFLHAVGHFFGLPHTYAEINPAGASTVIPGPPTNASPPVATLEYVNRVNMQNCFEHGDGFCDTEADPFPSVATAGIPSGVENCIKSKGLRDGHGDFYVGPCDNIMSEYDLTRFRFTQQQYNYMAYIIMTRRLYLH